MKKKGRVEIRGKGAKAIAFVRGTDIPVRLIQEKIFDDGDWYDDLLREFPVLEVIDIDAALQWRGMKN